MILFLPKFMINVTTLILKSQLICFVRASSYVGHFNTRNKFNKLLTQKLLKQGYRYHKLRKTFSKIYMR